MVLQLSVSRASVLFEISYIHIGSGGNYKLFNSITIYVDYKESNSTDKH